jgi:hypothetical protein
MQNNNCAPPTRAAAIDNPCAYLPVLRGALYKLMSGEAKSQVRFGDQDLSFHNGNVKELRAEIRKLEAMCAQGGRAERVGPRFNPSTYGGGHGRFRNF